MGVDDGLALVLADRLLPTLTVLTTVFGNVPVSIATRNALLFRELLGRSGSLRVFEGAGRALDGHYVDARHVHGDDGLGDATRSMPAALLRTVESMRVLRLGEERPPSSQSVTVIGIGPATNIPMIVDWHGRSAVKRIILMSGVFFDIGNITPYAEFNAYCDPFALRETLALGIPTTFVPLDICRKVQLARASVETYARKQETAIAQLIAASHRKYMDFYREWEGLDGCFPHDALAVLVACAPEKFFSVRGRVTVDVAEATRGRTTIESDPSSYIDIVTGGALKWARETLAHNLGLDSISSGQA